MLRCHKYIFTVTKENFAYHANTQPKAQKSLGSHNFQLVTHPPLHTHSASASCDSESKAGRGLFPGQTPRETCLKVGRRLDKKAGLSSTSGPVSYFKTTTQPSGFSVSSPLAYEKNNKHLLSLLISPLIHSQARAPFKHRDAETVLRASQ